MSSRVTPFNLLLPQKTYTLKAPQTVTIDAKVYNFTNWSDGVSEPIRTILLNKDLSLTALYELVTLPPPPPKPPTLFNLTIRAGEGGTTYPAPGTYQYDLGTTTSVKAIPDKDYVFDHWTLDGINAGPSAILSFSMIVDRVVEAIFKYIPPPPTLPTPPPTPQVTQIFPLPFPLKLLTGWSVGSASKDVQMDIKWDEKVTTINQIILKGSLRAVQPFAAPSVGFKLSLNGQDVVTRDWLGGGTTASFDTNVGAKIIKGSNRFSLEIHKNTAGVGECGFEAILTQIEVTFTGVPPVIKPAQLLYL